MKTAIYNLIILDESGSMDWIRRQTINGCNETIDTIKSAQQQFADTQDHFVSIYAFQSSYTHPSRYLVKYMEAGAIRRITESDYEPCGGTPLYDAIGATLSDLKNTVKQRENAIGSVTIITDGEENSSEHYSLQKVAKMIEELKEMGWNFNFIGANIDVKQVAITLNIENTLEFQQDDAGTKEMFERERKSRMAYNSRINEAMADMACCREKLSDEEFRVRMKKAEKDYFNS